MDVGTLPVALCFGSVDPSLRGLTAVAVIGWLISSTVLSLLVIQILAKLCYDVLQRKGEQEKDT